MSIRIVLKKVCYSIFWLSKQTLTCPTCLDIKSVILYKIYYPLGPEQNKFAAFNDWYLFDAKQSWRN